MRVQWDQVCIAKGHWLQCGGRTDKALQSPWGLGSWGWRRPVGDAVAAAAAADGYENGGGDSGGKGGSGKNYCYMEA